ncbi:grainyhead-like, partial [Ilyodon furcidens]
PDVKVPLLQKRNDVTIFKTLGDLETQPVLFIPDIHFSTFQRHAFPAEDGEDGSGLRRLPFSDDEFGSPPNKMARADEPKKVLLYVRKESDEVFDALMLKNPTLQGLVEAVSSSQFVWLTVDFLFLCHVAGVKFTHSSQRPSSHKPYA